MPGILIGINFLQTDKFLCTHMCPQGVFSLPLKDHKENKLENPEERLAHVEPRNMQSDITDFLYALRETNSRVDNIFAMKNSTTTMSALRYITRLLRFVSRIFVS